MLLSTSFVDEIDGLPPVVDPLPDTLVFVLTGQSNMVGRYGPINTGGPDATDVNIKSVNFTSGLLETAADPLDHFDETANTVGPGLTFAKAVLVAHPGKTIILIPSAEGGTGFFTEDWNRGDTLYNDAVARVATGMALAIAFDAGAELVGIIRIQGEKELDGTQGAEIFGIEFECVNNGHIRDFRVDVPTADEDTPFVYGGLPPDFLDTTTNGPGVQTAISDITGLINKTGYADSILPTELPSEAGDAAHYSAASSRSMGDRLAAAWELARANNIAEPTLPSPPAGTLEYHFDVTGVPDGNAVYDVSSNDVIFLNRRVYLDDGEMAFRKQSLNSRLQILDANHTELGTLDFSLRVSMTPGRVTGTSSTSQGIWGRWIVAGSNRTALLRLNGDDVEFFGSSNGSSAAFSMVAVNAVSVGVSVDIEVERVGTAMQLRIDNVQQDTETLAGGFTFFANSEAYTIGDFDSAYGSGGSREIDMLLESLTLEFL